MLLEKKDFLITALGVAFERSEAGERMGPAGFARLCEDLFSRMYDGRALDLGPLYETLTARPDVAAATINPPFLAVKSWEGILGVLVKLPDEIERLPQTVQRYAASQIGLSSPEALKLINSRMPAPSLAPTHTTGQVPALRQTGQVPALRQSGQVALRQSGQVALRQSGQVPLRQSGQVPLRQSGQVPPVKLSGLFAKAAMQAGAQPIPMPSLEPSGPVTRDLTRTAPTRGFRVGVVSLLVLVATIGGVGTFAWHRWVREPELKPFEPLQVAHILVIENGTQKGVYFVATIADREWDGRSADDRQARVASLLSSLAGQGVVFLTLTDKTGKVRALASADGSPVRIFDGWR